MNLRDCTYLHQESHFEIIDYFVHMNLKQP